MTVHSVLQSVRGAVRAAVQSEDAAAFPNLLGGQGLPRLGGETEPAEWMADALDVLEPDPTLTDATIDRLTAAIQEWTNSAEAAPKARQTQVVGGESVDGAGTARRALAAEEGRLFNAFLLATYLRRDQRIFDALHRFHENAAGVLDGVRPDLGPRAARQLRQALTHQQTDDRMEDYWFSLIGGENSRGLSEPVADEDDLLTGWAGLIYVPPGQPIDEAIDLERAEKGLRRLAVALEGSSEIVDILAEALRALDRAFPSSTGFWMQWLERDEGENEPWPIEVQAAAMRVWPAADPLSATRLELPERLHEGWQELPLPWRRRFAEGNKTKKQGLIDGLVFDQDSPIVGWGAGDKTAFVNALKEWALGPAQSRSDEDFRRLAKEDEAAAEADQADPSPSSGRSSGFDRAAAFDEVQRAMKDIVALFRDRPQEADRRLRQTVAHQHEIGTEPEFIAKTWSQAAAAVLEAGELEQANEYAQESMRLNPDDPIARNGLAEVLKAQDRLEKSEALYQETADRWPDNVVTRNGLAGVLKARDRLDEAEAMYRETVDRWPDNVVVRNGLADVLKARDRLDEAEALYRDTVDRWPNNVVARNGLAEVLKARDRLDEAEALYRETVDRWPDNVVACTGLAEVLKAQDRLEEAETLYRETAERWPDNMVVRNGLANLLRLRGRYSEALGFRPEPDSLVSYQARINLHLRGMILLNFGRYDEAVDCFRRGLGAETMRPPQRAYFRSALAIALLRQRNYDEAVAELEAAIQTAASRSQRDCARILQMHAYAANENWPESIHLHQEVGTVRDKLNKPAQIGFALISTTFQIEGDRRANIPEDEADELLEAEIEMCLAA